jgi:tRNA(Ile)-lysidine synthase
MGPSPSRDDVDRFRDGLRALVGPDPGRLGIAFSGGPDSLALLLLAAAAFPGEVAAATVDHGLRAESAAEAELARRASSLVGVPHRTLRVEVPRGASIQAQARQARYRALAKWAETQGIAILLTAHHADDQAETLLMRLLRGSGVGGLAGVRPSMLFEGRTPVCRPLLGWRRSELAAIVEGAGLAAVADPSNADPAYDRARLRLAIAQADWVDPAGLARSAAALAEADEALDFAAAQAFAERAVLAGGAAVLSPEGLPDELLRRLLLRCLRHVAAEAAPRGVQLGALASTLRGGGAATLAGVKCTGGTVWRFEPEPSRHG